MKLYFMTVPAQGVVPARRSKTLPFFTSSIKSPIDGKTYLFQILGTDPTKTPASTTIRYRPILLRVHFPNGVVLDPTLPACNDDVAVADRFFQSPLFADYTFVSNGIDVGKTQLIDAFQRAQFWQYVAGTAYHVRLSAIAEPIVVDVGAPSGSTTVGGSCARMGHELGKIDYQAYDAIIRQLTNEYVATNELAIVFTYNVIETDRNVCCIAGYHGAYARPSGTQIYLSAAYGDASIFRDSPDIQPWSEELGSMFDDPFTHNATPPWPPGEVGCRSSLEVGLPLGRSSFFDREHGFSYHPDEPTFYSWFFGTPSTGTGGLYSLKGSLSKPSQGCR